MGMQLPAWETKAPMHAARKMWLTSQLFAHLWLFHDGGFLAMWPQSEWSDRNSCNSDVILHQITTIIASLLQFLQFWKCKHCSHCRATFALLCDWSNQCIPIGAMTGIWLPSIAPEPWGKPRLIWKPCLTSWQSPSGNYKTIEQTDDFAMPNNGIVQ